MSFTLSLRTPGRDTPFPFAHSAHRTTLNETTPFPSPSVTPFAHARSPTATRPPSFARTLISPALPGTRRISASDSAYADGVRPFLNVRTYFQP